MLLFIMGSICSKINRLKIPQKVLNKNSSTPEISKKSESLSKTPNEQSQRLNKQPGFLRNVTETAAGVVLGNAISNKLSNSTNSRPAENTANSPTKTDHTINNEYENRKLTAENNNELQGKNESTEYDKEEEYDYYGDDGDNDNGENDNGENDLEQ